MRIHAVVLAVLLAGLLVLPVEAYKGTALARGAVDGFSLTDQDGATYRFDQDSEGIVVVSFLFTSCPDVCPVLTQSLKEVRNGLSTEELEDVSFVSITVDPDHDTPERLMAYRDVHGADWPHLTGSSDVLEKVWASFGVGVQREAIQTNTTPYRPAASSLTVVDTNGSAHHRMAALSVWSLTEIAAKEAGWSFNTSVTNGSRTVESINEIQDTDNDSWSWALVRWNAERLQWDTVDNMFDDVNALDTPHIAWVPSLANISSIDAPPLSDWGSVSVVWPNQSVEVWQEAEWSAYIMTQGTLEAGQTEVSINDSSFGHYLTSIDNEEAPEDYAWWWNIFAWNESEMGWESSMVGMDEMLSPGHIAWAPSYTNITDIPPPLNGSAPSECNGHGSTMGTGEGRHCMCVTGYGWDGEDRLSCVTNTTSTTSIGHSTVTYIVDPQRVPVVAWTGDAWRSEDMLADLRELMERENLGGHTSEITPSLPFMLTALTLMAAVAVFAGKQPPSDPEQKGKIPHRLR